MDPGAYLDLRLGINWETRWWLLGRKGIKHAVSTGPKEAGWGLARRSLGGAGGSGMCQRVLFCHRSRQAGQEAGRELGRAGAPRGHANWEGQAGHVRTRETAWCLSAVAVLLCKHWGLEVGKQRAVVGTVREKGCDLSWWDGVSEQRALQVRSLPLWLSQILVLLAEGRTLPEASPGGLADVPAFSPHPWWLGQ